jgi:hypothetical protein
VNNAHNGVSLEDFMLSIMIFLILDSMCLDILFLLSWTMSDVDLYMYMTTNKLSVEINFKATFTPRNLNEI